jgi:hypothetical protein
MNKTAKNRNFLKIGAVLLLAFAWAIVPFTMNSSIVEADNDSDIRIGATLTGAAIGGVTPSGFAEHRLDDSGRRRLTVQAFSVNLASGTLLDIYINNQIVGQIAVNNGSGFFDIDTNNGQTVPSVSSGNPITLRQGATTILSGTFGIVSPSPSPSVSPSGSPSPSVSPTGSPSPSPSVSPSVSPSPSPTVSPNPSPSPNGGDLFAALSGATLNGVLPNGFAQYELHSSRRELEIRVRQVNLPPGTALTVTVSNVAVGNLILEGGGEGRLRLRTDNGQTVPVVVAGDSIVIRNGGAPVLSGTFIGFSATPSPSPSQGRYFETHLTGSQMTPPVNTNATGEVKIFLNQTENQATIIGEFHNLSSAQTNARILLVTGDTSVVVDLGAIGGTSGNFASRTISVTPIQAAQLRTGLWHVVIGSANNPNGEIRGRLTTHSNSSDFDGDGHNDFAVFRPSSGTWYTLNTQGINAQVVGAANDKLVSGDYDGDGRTDAAVFRSSNGAGVWEIRRSSDGGVTTAQFGFASDTAVRGDFDGDGRQDLAVYRSSTGTWFVQNSGSNTVFGVSFGAAEDKPIAADFDGDGRSDISVFRPSTGIWYYLRSTDGGFGAVYFGQTGDIPIAGDFDGDGKADASVFRPSNGTWYIQRSSNGTFDFRQFGLGDDIPVAGNYDGDNKADIAVFRPSNGIWYIWRSVDGAFEYRLFGQNGDVPTPTR